MEQKIYESGGARMAKGALSAGSAVFARMPQPPAWLISESRLVRIARGELLLRSGDGLKYVYIVHSGKIMIFSTGENGQESKVVMVPEGGIVGEMEAIAGVERIVYSARAFEASELVRIPMESFLRWVCGDASACWGLTRVMAEKLCAASLQSSQYTSSNAMQRLVSQLRQIGAGRVSYTRQELAEACCMSLRTVNRCVKRLHEEGLISLSRGKIEIDQSQIEALEEWTNSDI